ncbi:MAG: hypothetical protein WDM84_00270 [Bauldia sp.]
MAGAGARRAARPGMDRRRACLSALGAIVADLGRLDAFEWRVGAGRPPARAPFEIEPMREADAPATAEPGEPAAARADLAAVAAPRLAAAPRAAGEAPNPPMAVAAGGVAPKGVRPMARAPDDPGPLVADEEDEGADLPIFHPGRTA